jgi:hypothetical protein
MQYDEPEVGMMPMSLGMRSHITPPLWLWGFFFALLCLPLSLRLLSDHCFELSCLVLLQRRSYAGPFNLCSA